MEVISGAEVLPHAVERTRKLRVMMALLNFIGFSMIRSHERRSALGGAIVVPNLSELFQKLRVSRNAMLLFETHR